MVVEVVGSPPLGSHGRFSLVLYGFLVVEVVGSSPPWAARAGHMLKTIGFIVFFEVDKGPRDRNANRDDVARRSRGGRREVAGRSRGDQGGRETLAFIKIDFERSLKGP